MPLQIINPLEYPNWDKLLLTNKDYSFFHSSSWARVLSESYNYKPLYFTLIKDGRLSTLIPIMEVDSFLTGKRGVSLPFTDYCEPIVPDKDSFNETIEKLIEYGKDVNWKYIEWRGGGSYLEDTLPSLSLYVHSLSLEKDEKKLLSCFRKSTKRNIKKAEKEGVDVSIYYSLESLREFYRLNCMTRKKHGLPPQPFLFFKKIYEHIIAHKKGFVALASYGRRTIAGAMYFHIGKKAIFKYGASDEKHLNLRPNNLVIWEAIKWYKRKGFTNINLGITEPNNIGLLQFKRGWGVKEEMTNYYKYVLEKDEFVKDKFRNITSYSFFKKMPSAILNLTGSMIYRHFG